MIPPARTADLKVGLYAGPGLALILLLVMAGCSRAPRFETPEARLLWMWTGYTARYLHPSGFVVDPSRGGGLVTSEGQSYALLQAVWVGDREVFARVLEWTRAHLRRPDGLHSWLWDPHGGRVKDANTATDADVDIAFALALASVTFGEPAYAREARGVVRAIREHARLDIGDAWVISAGNWAAAERVTNLSYFAPYAYAYFDRLDPEGDWIEAVEIGYDLIDRVLSRPRSRLPEDFVRVTPDGGVESLPPSSPLGRQFSFDAIRVLWRIEFDCRLSNRARACAAADRMVEVLAGIAERDRGFYSAYDVAGLPRTAVRSTSFYGAFLPAFTRVRPDLAARWRRTSLSDDQLDVVRRSEGRYYDANWAWFGVALADGMLPARTPPPARMPAIR